MFQSLGFLASPSGMMVTGIVAALIVIMWEWRFALAALFLVQLAVAAVSVVVHDVPAQWALIQVSVMALSAMILGLSAMRTGIGASYRQSGTWLLRAAPLVFIYVCWRYVDLYIALPVIVPEIVELFTWLILCGMVILALGESPLFVAVALLMWFVPIQAIVAILLSIPSLVAVIGILQLLLALACSYLLLVERLGRVEERPVITDMVFPEQTSLRRPRRRTGFSSSPSLGSQSDQVEPLVPLFSAERRAQGKLEGKMVPEGESADLQPLAGEPSEH